MRIGLLAMSGVRAKDPDLLAFGLTLPGFVERSKVIASLPSLGLLYLAAVTPEGHDLRYFEAEGDGNEPAAVYDCDLVAISTFSAQVFEAYAIADRLRANGVKVAMGGLHVSVRPEEAALHADYVVIGEGENVWPEVVRVADAEFRGLEFRGLKPTGCTFETRLRGLGGGRIFRASDFDPVDVAQLPIPRYDLLKDRPYTRITVQTSRGCPWRCDFCASSVMLARGYRLRPVEHVIRDLEAIKRLYSHPFIELADDNTFVNKAWSKELCRAMIPLKLKWFTETDISVADDPELLSLMRQAGCRQVLIGLESPDRDSLLGLEMRRDFKARRHADNADAVRRIQAAGITVNGCFIVGLDHHTPEIFAQILEYVESIPLFEVQVTVLTPFPGTPLYERLEREGRLTHPGQWDRCTLFDINYRPKRMSADEIRTGLYWLGERLYDPARMTARRESFHQAMRRPGHTSEVSRRVNSRLQRAKPAFAG